MLWILPEGRKTASECPSAYIEPDSMLDKLARRLCKSQKYLKDIDPHDIEFFSYDDRIHPIRMSTPLSDLNTTDSNPLVFRYPLSENIVVTNVRFLRSSIKVRVPHSTGTWYMLVDATRANYEKLQDGRISFYYYYLDEDAEETIVDEILFNHLLRQTSAHKNELIINLSVGIKGKKAYTDWNIEEVLKDVLRQEHRTTITDIPQFNIESEFSNMNPELTENEINRFTANIEANWRIFNKSIINEASARFFIDSFMSSAVSHVNREHSSMILCVEQLLNGTRGYGYVDYLVKCYEIVVLVTEAELEEIHKRIAQNLVQLHTALEQSLGKRKRGEDVHKDGGLCKVYGIVTTGETWRFLRLAGCLTKPEIGLSPEFICNFNEVDQTPAKSILRLITCLLKSQADILKAETEKDRESGEVEQDDTERRLARVRTE
ncbi:324_t:CDS:2 [Paraglomus occultum]|uniref:324_t:CDS:1 n=1 Tax=Paraglomus occultum TaxID=144539 RepID=A0A9N8W4E9_9GLOM|nr:324_t:CDS:2 [Paraglomus occultum]